MTYDSPHWMTDAGLCVKHYVPHLPCPSCLAGEGDDDLSIKFDDMDRSFVEFDGGKLIDLVPINLLPGVKSGRIETRVICVY